jgi:hypothetical protein
VDWVELWPLDAWCAAMKGLGRLLLFVLVALGVAMPALAHVGNKDVFEQVNAGPYKLFVTVRTPNVIPGVATIEVRTSGPAVNSIRITPLPLTGEASKHPPASDAMKSSADPAFFTGSLWLMASGSWQVRFEVNGAAGAASASVPVPAMPLSILPMQRPMGIGLGVMGLILVLGMAGIVAAAVREARLEPGMQPGPSRTRRALIASGVTLGVMVLAVYGGAKWWNVEAAGYAADIYRPLSLEPVLSGNTLDLKIGTYDDKSVSRLKARTNDDLLPDHGHLMHLYAIRQPGMDAVFHLHPAQVSAGDLQMTLPEMPAGTYKLYADIVHASGFPETLTAELVVPAGMQGASLASEDASATPPALSQGELGPTYKLPDGYTMVWERPAEITANTAYAMRFRLLDPAGKPAADMQPYLGMAGHAAFVKDDGSAFAHTHPEGSAAMAAMMLANGDSSDMAGMDMSGAAEKIAPVVDFPYGFPSAGPYRVFVQMKRGGTVETGVFDALVR